MQQSIREAILRATVATATDALAQAACEAVDVSTMALARIWLFDQSPVLRLVASLGRPIGGGSYHQINGQFAVVRGGPSKISRIASTGEAMITRGLRGDEPWLENAAWIARQGIRSFIGLPIVVDREVFGVMAAFDRTLTSDETIDGLRFLTDVVAIRCRHLLKSADTSRGAAAGSPNVSTNEPAITTRQQLRALEKRSIELALGKAKGKVFGSDGAAALLAMKPTTLASRMKSLGIR